MTRRRVALARSIGALVGLCLIVACSPAGEALPGPASSPAHTALPGTPSPSTATPARSTPTAVTRYIAEYRISYSQCSSQAERIYSQAGTRDAHRAAQWLSEVFMPGEAREGSIAGCYDALIGARSRYP